MTPVLSTSFLRIRRLRMELWAQLVSMFHIFCDLKEAQTVAEQQGTPSEYLARIRLALQSLQILQDTVAALLTSIVKLLQEIKGYCDQSAPNV